jgi:hypothetical protein
VGIRITLATVAAAGLTGATLGLVLAAGGGEAAQTRAAAAASTFFRSLNARHYARTCELMSARFYHDNHVPSKARCVLGLRTGFMWAPSIRFRILGVSVDGRRAVVSAVANGARGRIVLVEEHGSYRVLSVLGP